MADSEESDRRRAVFASVASPSYHDPVPDTPASEYSLVSFSASVPVHRARPPQRPQQQSRSASDSKEEEDLGDDSEMWKMYLNEVEEEDSRFTNAWKEDANGILVFTGLFGAIVGAFIIEFYKKLSPDPNTANQSSSHSTAMVCVNILWLISLVLSLTCALIATLLQQWARRYTETPRSPKVLRHRVRVRALLLHGANSYKILLIVEMLPTLLHLSVYLFLSGLVIIFHTIDKKVAIAVDVAVGISGLAYLTLTILPCLDVRCPYRTPVSQIVWYPCHAFLSFAAPFLHRFALGLRKLLGQKVQSSEYSVSDHLRFLKDGLEKSICICAVETLRDGDGERVTWLFNRLALGDRQTFLKFAASIPIPKIPDLVPSIKSVPFRESLLILLRSATAGSPSRSPGFAAWPDPDVPSQSLLVCLHAIRHIAKADAPPSLDLDFMRDYFADTHMRELWNHTNDTIRVTSRSICALVAKQVAKKVNIEVADLSWLQEVIGKPLSAILEADVTVRDQMNFKSFVVGALQSNFGPSNPYARPPGPQTLPSLSTEDLTSFNETLAILLGITPNDSTYFTTPEWQTRLSEQIARIKQHDPEGSREVYEKLRFIFPNLLSTSAIYAVPPPHNNPLSSAASPYDAARPHREVSRRADTPFGDYVPPSRPSLAPRVASRASLHPFVDSIPTPYVPRSSGRSRSPHGSI